MATAITSMMTKECGIRIEWKEPPVSTETKSVRPVVIHSRLGKLVPKGKPAVVDYDRRHYDANPGNLKIALSGRPYDGTQIIACSGTSVMMAGAMRYLGIPARWLGTATEKGARTWDANGNGLLDREEVAFCTNGHRYTQVWLGDHYGWTCFDATPR